MLSIKDLNKTYPNGTKALNNVNLEISKGMFGLLGPNGAGKSSLMRTIATLQLADSGSIEFNGTDVFSKPEELRKVLGYLPQDFGVYPKVSAEMMLNHIAKIKGIQNSGERKAYVADLLNKVNLYKFRKRNLGDYSGGMRQRFGIAQALIGNPKLIIVDEPTAGLDPLERNRFHNLLSELGEEAVVILSTHIVDDVINLCTNMAVFNEGQVLVQGHPMELTNSLNGKVFRKSIKKEEIATYEENYTVLSSYLRGGNLNINVYADNNPGEGFEVISNTLEDFYFYSINQKAKQTV
ncbi:MAG: ABC transporter ATP-binding protein [Cellulophaga sp.]|uniref:ABC transporter ATP-binding protein n=1 Tax=unclassified Cellulophaga TaxID=2634405 RepID=UPI000C2BA42A|nr:MULTISPECIES: ABC transporter ATP-binding protein [unclassified Cellulophaga]MDO6489935.1 ABC transporter ATP-binding protein [Cellulophaga sp. 2_MG-2023]MDO6494871.1 ABC transporter ATP-binding protein [Cellulophaga sp. 3_MG-2023]PKB42432.1 ABC-type multidrug transport system ATPase subunit [Cellulophaga sp. RHA19]